MLNTQRVANVREKKEAGFVEERTKRERTTWTVVCSETSFATSYFLDEKKPI
jgi:hypothetical protein